MASTISSTSAEVSGMIHDTEDGLNPLSLNNANSEVNSVNSKEVNSGISVIDGESEGVVTGTSQEQLPKLNLPKGFVETSTSVDAKDYNTSHRRRGHCLVFNHHIFEKSTGLGERNGTNTDRDSIVSLFKMIGFEVKTFNNLSVNEIMNCLEHYSREVDHTENACFIVVFMSHGEDGHLYGRNAMFKAESLYSPFTADNCLSLAGKPKIFIIQACRGEGLDSGVSLVHRTRDETDAGDLSVYKIPSHSDFLICWSTVPGHFAWRNTTNGSWFIQSVVRIFSKEADKEDVFSMMTNVNRHMINNFESNCPSSPGMHMKKQSACIVSTLMRKVYLMPRAQQ